jgi:predicted ATPase/class 3 adenylate cyclase/Tfp pilus assembly protein PilF
MNRYVALLQLDLVDSTRLGESLGDYAMAELSEQHDRVARDLLRHFQGTEIDKSDGFLLMFQTVAQAARYAAAYHAAAQRVESHLRARAGIHYGQVQLRPNLASDIERGAKPLEIDGRAKPMTARIMAVAAGRQTLLSASAMSAFDDQEGLFVRSHGFWQGKGLAQPVELFEVRDLADGFTSPQDIAAMYRVIRRGDVWLPARTIEHHLPATPDIFIGRKSDLSRLREAFDSVTKLVTLLGPGGVGKTRLAKRFGQTWLGDYEGGVWFCDISQAMSSDGIAQAVSNGLQVPLGRGDPVLQLAHAIAGRGRCLVILDNVEQVTRPMREAVSTWLSVACEAQLIATSRERLGVDGEQLLRVEVLEEDEATELFVARARQVVPSYAPEPADVELIRSVVMLLDCLPLALELAAARLESMSVRTLRDRLADRFGLLSAKRLNTRHATLEATITWSWDLLDAAERTTLAQLAVFEGDIAAATAEDVVVLDPTDSDSSVWNSLHSLVGKSLLKYSAKAERFNLLSSVRLFALNRLKDTAENARLGVDLGSIERRHFDSYARRHAESPQSFDVRDLDDLVAACRRASAAGAAIEAVATLEAAWRLLRLRGPFKIGLELTDSAANIPAVSSTQRAITQRVRGEVLKSLGMIEAAKDCLTTSLHLAAQVGDQQCGARARSQLGMVLSNEGRLKEAGVEFRRAHEFAVRSEDRLFQCETLSNLGNLEQNLGHLVEAETYYRELLASAREIGDRRWEGGAHGSLGLTHALRGDCESARLQYESALAVAREIGDKQFEGNTTCNLGLLLLDTGESDLANEVLSTALGLARILGHRRLTAVTSCNLGLVSLERNDLTNASKQLDEALTIARELGDRRSEGQFLGYLAILLARQRRFDEAEQHFETSQNVLCDVGDNISLGIVMTLRAQKALLCRAEGEAEVFLRRAGEIASAYAPQEQSDLQRQIRRTRTMLETGHAP